MKNNDIKLDASIADALKTTQKVKELVNNHAELDCYLSQLNKNLDDAIKNMYQAYKCLDKKENNIDDLNRAKKLLYASSEKTSNVVDLISYVTRKDN